MRRTNKITRWIGAAAAAWLLAAPAGLSATTAWTIGVVNFAERPALPNISGVFPGRSAADTATTLLERTVHPPVTVIARKTVAQAEAAMEWRPRDITVFARLKELANRAGAAHLVVGTVDRLSSERFAGQTFRSMATVSVQVFTPQPTRITKAVTGSGSAMSTVPANAANQALRQAVEEALKAARAATAAGP